MLKKLSMILIAAVLFIGILPLQGLQVKAVSTIKGGHQTTTDGVFSYEKITEENVEIGIKITGFNDSKKEVIVPDQLENLPVTEIGDEAFKNSDIEKIILPKGLVTIGISAFESTVWLKNIELPNSLTTLGEMVFKESGIESIIIPDGVTDIEKGMFASTNSLENIKLPNNLTSIGVAAFYKSGIEKIIIPDGVTTIGESVFEGSGIETIKIPDGVTSLESRTFMQTSSLKKIELPKNLKTIDYGAFEESGVEELKIPDGVTTIGIRAFLGTTALKNIELSKNLTKLGMRAFWESGIEAIKIPDGVTVIEEGTFGYADALKIIELPKNLTSIGKYVFYNTSSLKNIELPKDLMTIEELAFNGSGIESIKIPDGVTTIENGLFTGAVSLKNIELPKKLIKIKELAFLKTSALEYLILPEGLKTIEKSVFLRSGLKELLIPETVNDIHATAFENLKDITIFGVKGSKAEELAKSKVSEGFKFVELEPLITTIMIDYKSFGHESGRVPNIITQSKVEIITVGNEGMLDKEKEYLSSWNEERDGMGRNYSVGSRFLSHRNLTLYAQWQPKKIVTFNVDNNQLAKVYIEPNQKVVAPKAPTKTNHIFEGWYKESDFKTKWDFESDLVTEDLTMYAKWIAYPKVSFETNNGNAVEKVIVEPNQKVKAPTSPTKTNHIFEGWYKESDFKTKWDFTKDTVTNDLTLYAKWTYIKTVFEKMPIKIIILSEVSDAALVFDGVTSPNAAVSLQSEGVEIATGISNHEGRFSIKLPPLMANMKLRMQVIDKIGQTKIIPIEVLDRTPPKIILPKWDGVSTEIIGTAEVGTTIELHINDKLVATTIANENNNYSLNIGKINTDTKIEIWAIDKAGNIVKQALPKLAVPLFVTINSISDKDTMIIGATVPKAKVEIYVKDKLMKTLTAGKSGSYSYKVKKKKAGTVIKVIVKDLAGNIATKTVKVLDKTPPKKPTVKTITTKTTKLTGKAEANSIVRVYKGKTLISKTTATKKGQFSIKIKKQKKGTVLTIYAKDKANNKSESVEIKVKKA